MFLSNPNNFSIVQPDGNLSLVLAIKFQYSSDRGRIMKNSEYTIYTLFKDKCINKFRKEKEGWILTSSNGKIRPCTTEQMVSHLLPALAGIKGPHVTVKVEPDEKIEI